MNSTLILSYLPSIIGLIIVAAAVYVSNPSKRVNRYFAKLNAVVAVWLTFLFIADSAETNNSVLFFLRLGLSAGSFVAMYFILFASSFSTGSKSILSKFTQIYVRFIGLTFALLSLTPLVIISASKEHGVAVPIDVTPLYTLQFVYSLTSFLLGIIILRKVYISTDEQTKNQIKYLILGLGIAMLVNTFVGFLFVGSEGTIAGPLSLFIFALFTGYAIVRHKLFDIRVLVVKSLTYLGTLLTAAVIPVIVVFSFLDTYVESLDNRSRILFFALFTTAMIIVSQPLKKMFDRVTKSIFSRNHYITEEVLDTLSHVAIAKFDMDELANDSLKVISNALNPTFSSLILLDSNGAFYEDYGSLGGKKIEGELAELLFEKEGQVFATNELEVEIHDSESNGSTGELYDVLNENDISLSAKLRTKEEVVGILLFGPKGTGNAYTQQDMDFVATASNELAVAIQNARRFDEIKRFNETLQLEIERATKELRESNEKLQALDQAKDEFVSMASHQLRTPLTSVKGYLSMVLEGDVGKVDKKQRDLLSAAFASSQRMVYLIADLLNVSRLQTGKFVIEPVLSNLPDVIESEIDQIRETAKNKQLKIHYKKPHNFPPTYLDETKIRQVIMNFIDNAIYYTKPGGKIEVELEADSKKVEFRVKDNGIGVPKHEQKNMFTKFYRAENAKKARPDGTGLGLFMARKVIVDQGGAVIFESKEGKGSTFGFTFPMTRIRPPKDVLKKSSEEAKK